MSLVVSDLSVRRGTAQLLDGVALTAAPGVFTGIIGPNGAGKTTLLRSVAGLTPSEGGVELSGRALSGKVARFSSIAYMPQDLGAVSALSAIEVVLLGRLRSLGLRVPRELVTEAEAMLDRFGLLGLQNRTLDTLSGGQRQLLHLAQAMFRQPDVLLLDEPTAALDLRHQVIVLEAVAAHAARENMVAVAAMHDLSLAARFCDQLICLANGRVVAAGSPESVLSAERLSSIYGVETEIAWSPGGRMTITPLRAT